MRREIGPAHGPHEWDARTYSRIGEPQLEWGRRVLARLPLDGGETVIDAGCGSGRVTELLLERLPRGRVLALDRSHNMIEAARELLAPRFGARVELVEVDLLELAYREVADAVFSAATFHWVSDHDRLFARLYRALKPGGRLVAQCGGAGNLARLMARADRLLAAAPFAARLERFAPSWHFEDAAATAARLRAAGFVEVRTDLELAPTQLADAARWREFVATVVLRETVAALADDALADRLLAALADAAATDDPPFTLDYVRLNLAARRPA